MHTIDFNTLSQALLLYYQTRDSLFTDQILWERSGFPEGEIEEAFEKYFHVAPKKLIGYLQPDAIKFCIKKTAAELKSHRLVNPFISIEAMDGENSPGMTLLYQFAKTRFGHLITASTKKGVSYIAFVDNGTGPAIAALRKRFPSASLRNQQNIHHTSALAFIDSDTDSKPPVSLHLKGTPFQISVWKKLLQIPKGGLMSYAALAGNRKDAHALGNAVGANPVAYIIPCHRAVSASGEFGQYHWGKARKAILICLEMYQSALKIADNSC